MRLSPKIIDNTISELVGEDVVPLVKQLINKKNVSEFKLAEQIKQEVNYTRNMLYRLYEHSLVTFVRRKDKIKGWYIYYWTLDTNRIKYLNIYVKKKKLEMFKERLKRETDSQFYTCNDRCIRLDFEQSMNFEFKCPECGTLIDLEDNSKKIEQLKSNIDSLENELKETKKKPDKGAEKKIKKAKVLKKQPTKISKSKKKK